MKEAPPPAEAATDVGQDDSPETLGTLIVFGIAVIVGIALIAFSVGFFL